MAMVSKKNCIFANVCVWRAGELMNIDTTLYGQKEEC